MSIATARRQLKKALAPLGFVQRESNLLWARTDEVMQLVQISKVRRTPDLLEVDFAVWSPFGTAAGTAAQAIDQPLLQETVGTWKMDHFDADDAAWRISQIGAAFTRAADLARHYGDRYCEDWIGTALRSPLNLPLLDHIPARISYAHPVSAPSEAQAEAILCMLEHDLFSQGWQRGGTSSRHWIHHGCDGGFQYCAYLLPNKTRTLAHIVYFTATAADLGNPRAEASMRRLFSAVKYAVRDGTRVFHLPLLQLDAAMVTTATVLLHESIGRFPANAIHPAEDEE